MAEIQIPERFQHYQSPSTFVICAEDLPIFCKMWHYSDLTHNGFNPYLQLNLKVQELPAPSNPEFQSRLSRTAQKQLIEPFAVVKHLSKIVITGPVEESVKEEFYRKEQEPGPTPEHCLDECDRLKDEGNKAMVS